MDGICVLMEGVEVRMRMAERLPKGLHFSEKWARQSSTFILRSPPIDSLATIGMFCRRSGFPRVRILQQASVMLGHCRMRSRSKPQLHARSAVGSSGPDERAAGQEKVVLVPELASTSH